MPDFYFAQLTDLHVGMRGHCAEFDWGKPVVSVEDAR